MQFRTIIKVDRADFTLCPGKRIALLGSCFAENIAERMRLCLWHASNPLGTLYNPLSIERAIRFLLFDGDISGESDAGIFKAGRMHYSWLFDSKTSSEYLQECIESMLRMRNELEDTLSGADALFVTFGTSWCYFLADNPGYVVANCHKQPAAMFERRRITVGEITETWTRLCADLKERYPQLRIVFTVSPVRHLKDGFSGNARSKAVLQLAVEEICNRLDYCSYFPAYEIVNDDLRDYRFYASDMVHPSDEAIDYIWEVFKSVYIDKAGEELLKEGEKIVKGWNHRPLHSPYSTLSPEAIEEESKRRADIAARYEALRSRYPGILPLDYSKK